MVRIKNNNSPGRRNAKSNLTPGDDTGRQRLRQRDTVTVDVYAETAANVMRCLTWHRCYSLYHISVTQPRSQSNPQRPMMGQVSSQSETKRQTTMLLRHCQPSASNYAPLYARLLSIRCRLLKQYRPRLDCTQRRYCRQGRLEMGHNWMMYVRRI